MSTMAKIEAVLFDYGMVLSGPPDAAARKHMEELLSADSHTFDAAYWKFRDAYDRGALSGKAYWHEVAKELIRPVDASTIAALIDADTTHWAQPNEAMVAWAAALQRAGVKTGILSNMGDAMEHGLVAKHLWLQNFGHTTFSHRLGIAKPDNAIYASAIDGLGIPPEAILFIDDREENIEAARAAGMAAILYNAHPAFVSELKRAGYTEFLDLS
jgi:putative hydrolase of the HAD superfamily